jgi:hypothetical protein
MDKSNCNCVHWKDLQKVRQENNKMKMCLDRIRDIELEELDVDWDEYKAQKQNTDFSSIITYCEIGLGEQEEG